MNLLRSVISGCWMLLSVPVLLLFSVAPIYGSTIEYVATNLADINPGEDLWRYDYIVSGAFASGSFFDIYFDPFLFSNLVVGPAPNADWDVSILQQPNPLNFPPFDTGIFDAFALVDNPSLAGVYSVSFIYLGAGTPGVQPFDVFDTDSTLLEQGRTRPTATTVPEPSTLLLSVLGMVGCGIKLHFHRTRLKA